MLETFRNAWKIEDLRKRLLFTLLILVLFRLGCALPVPYISAGALTSMFAGGNGDMLEYLNMMSGGALSECTLFALGVQPAINASIIMQLLTYALPPLERLRDEGEEGQKKLNKITAAVSLALSAFMSYAYYVTLKNQMGAVYDGGSTAANVFIGFVIVMSFIAGTSIVVWMGNRINDKGIGNGISMLLFAGILARFPTMAGKLYEMTVSNPSRYFFESLLVLVLFVAMIVFIVFMNAAERRIPIQYAKRVVGRKQYGGQSTHIPVKICMSGVMPIIFAMSFMSLPSTISLFKQPYANPSSFGQRFYNGFLNFFNTGSWTYALIYFVLIIAFNYFYVAMQYNPIEIANNLRQNNGGIPGIRPGKPTSDYIQRILNKITLVGAFFLGVIAIFPIFMTMADPNLSSLAMGGTTVLIVVSVALETVRTLESELMMRHHKGFLE